MAGIVFDCDGVLVDSEPLSDRAWTDVLAPYGYVPGEADIAHTKGRSDVDTLAHYRSVAAIPSGVDVQAAYVARRDALFATELEAFPDAVDAVRALAAEGIPLACASSSRGGDLRFKLERFDLLRYFESVVSFDDVTHAKPAPDLYLAAAAGLGIDPRHCVAIEDTEVGADAAVAAGMRVVIVARHPVASDRHSIVSAVDAGLIRMMLS